MIRLRLTPFNRLRWGVIRDVSLAQTHTLADVAAVLAAELGAAGTDWWVSFGWPTADEKHRVRASWPAATRPLGALGLTTALSLAYAERGRESHLIGVLAIDDAPGPDAPTVTFRLDDETPPAHIALWRALQAEALVDAPPGLDPHALARLSGALERLAPLRFERDADPVALGQAWLAVAEAWPGVLAGGRDKLTLTRLGAHLRRTWEEPARALEALGGAHPVVAPPGSAPARAALAEALAPLPDHHLVPLYADALVECGRAAEAAEVLRADGCSPAGGCPVLEHVVATALALDRAGAHAEAEARLRDVAARRWGPAELHAQARAWLGERLAGDAAELAALRASWKAAEAQRRGVLARR